MAEKQAKQSQPSMATLSPKMQAYLDTQTQADEQVAERSTTSAEELEIIDTLISFPYWYGPGLVGSLYE
jgi:hypothetical protein